MKKEPKIEDLIKRPVMDADTCVCCASPLDPKTDCKGRPYVHCGSCGTKVFFKTDWGRIGYDIASKVIKKNTGQHKSLVDSQYRKFIQGKKPLLQK